MMIDSILSNAIITLPDGSGHPIKYIEDITEDDNIIQHPCGPLLKITDAIRNAGISARMVMDGFIHLVHSCKTLNDYLKEECPNKRVIYLAFRAKKYHARKKNYSRNNPCK